MKQNEIKISWFQKYQPKTIDEYIFSNQYRKTKVKSWIENGYIEGNLLLHGRPGNGKTSLIRLLVELLIKNFDLDFYRIDGRTIKNIDELNTNNKGFLQNKSDYSIKRIVCIEEIDKLSSKNAIATLKDRMLEVYQDRVTFICTTNYINRIDEGLKRRFNTCWDINNLNIKDIIKRIYFILESENIEYDKEEVQSFIHSLNINIIGLSDIITLFENSVVDNKLILNNEIVPTEEERIINLTIEIKNIIEKEKVNDKLNKNLLLNHPKKSPIKDEWSEILQIIIDNYELDYNRILKEISYKISDSVPILQVINDFDGIFETKRLKWATYINFLREYINAILLTW